MIIPYRVKNPPKSFPAATVAIIGINVVVFALTSESFLAVKRSMVDAYALRWGVSPPITILTAMFLHGDIFHLLGNMLFLWVFGPAVEDRLRIPGYAGLYLFTGLAATAAQALLGAAGAHPIPTLGASGCIMGVLGAYWYLFPWSSVCMAYFFCIWVRVWYGVFEVAAIYVIGAYFALDLFSGFFFRAMAVSGGVAHFAHVGGAIAGVLLVWSLNAKRDSEHVSRARATHAEVKNLDLLSVGELRNLVAGSPEDEELLAKYTNKARESGTVEDIKYALTTDRKAVVTHCPMAAVHYLLAMQGDPSLLQPADLLYLGRWSEQNGSPEQALRLYEMLKTLHPDSPEIEMALMRTASILWRVRRDAKQALSELDALLGRFPAGAMVFEAEDLRDEISRADDPGIRRAA